MTSKYKFKNKEFVTITLGEHLGKVGQIYNRIQLKVGKSFPTMYFITLASGEKTTAMESDLEELQRPVSYE